MIGLGGFLVYGLFSADKAGHPWIAQDHWHAVYQVWVCGERQPNFPFWESGVHTEGDGIIHIHPFQTFEEGSGSSLAKFFENLGGLLTETQMRMPGDERLFENGEGCPDGSEAELSVWVNGEQAEDWTGYIPQDGDRITISFGDPDQRLSAPGRTYSCPPGAECPPPTIWEALTTEPNPRASV